MDVSQIDYIEFEGISGGDYPDFCDAVVVAATWKNGQDLTEAEIDELIDQHDDFVYEMLMKRLF